MFARRVPRFVEKRDVGNKQCDGLVVETADVNTQ